MKRKLLISVAAVGVAAGMVVALPSTSAAEEGPATSLDTEYLGTLKVATDPPQMVGPRLIFNVKNCTLQGAKINVTCVAPSADWIIVMPDGTLRPDIRATLKTNEGEFIFMESNGIIALSKDVTDRVGKGETITSKDGYFMGAPRFTTTSKSYGWLNSVQTVAKMTSNGPGKVEYDLFVVR